MLSPGFMISTFGLGFAANTFGLGGGAARVGAGARARTGGGGGGGGGMYAAAYSLALRARCSSCNRFCVGVIMHLTPLGTQAPDRALSHGICAMAIASFSAT